MSCDENPALLLFLGINKKTYFHQKNGFSDSVLTNVCLEVNDIRPKQQEICYKRKETV